MKLSLCGRGAIPLLLLLAAVHCIRAAEPVKGRLIIVGGGLRDNNTAVFERMVKYSGGAADAKIAVIPTASAHAPSAESITLILGRQGVPAKNVRLIDITEKNALKQAVDPLVAAQIKDCTGIYFQGGAQTRIMQALAPGGKETPALAAIRAVWKRGGVVAGSSAGAAVQSDWMLSVSGLPNDSLDEGCDALDFGITKDNAQRGLLAVPGLAFFSGGIIDQHFGQYRGRLGRLARATIERKVRFGFGIDENTGLDVAPDGTFEVIGEGVVTIVDSRHATCRDGALGCSISNLQLSCLKSGDRFDPSAGKPIIDPRKKSPVPGQESNNGNFLIPDIAGQGAVSHAMFVGLGDNTSRQQIGVTLKHHGPSAHGYRYTFQKTEKTRFLEAQIDGSWVNSILYVRLDIEPIDGALQDPDHRLPKDLAKVPERDRTALTALWRRGILLENEQHLLRPRAKITRAELAGAIAATVHLEPLRGAAPPIADVPADSPWRESIKLVVSNGLMGVDDLDKFRPDAIIVREDAAGILERLAQRYGAPSLPDDAEEVASKAELMKVSPENLKGVRSALRRGLLQKIDGKFRPDSPLTRLQTAQAIYAVIGFSWAKAPDVSAEKR